MPDMYHTGYSEKMDRRKVTEGSNAPVGIPRRETVVALTDDELCLKGPPIEINHAEEYNSLDYRVDNKGSAVKYGIAGIYDIEGGSPDWLNRNNISDVDEFGTTISFSGSAVSKGHKYIVYYYARTATHGGSNVSVVQGDEWWPETSDILVRKNNDSQPNLFGTVSGNQGNIYQYAPDMFSNTGVAGTLNDWAVLLNYGSTGTELNSTLPVYIEEIIVKFNAPSAWNTWPTLIHLDLSVDGEQQFKSFNTDDSFNHITYNDFDQHSYPESGGPWIQSPGRLCTAINKQQMMFDVYEDQNGKKVLKIPYKGEMVDDLILKIYCATTALVSVDCFVRGWFVD